MLKHVSIRLLATALLLAVCAMGVHAAIHWHHDGDGEQHCLACQVGHTSLPHSAPPPALSSFHLVARCVPATELPLGLEPLSAPKASRAPPA